MHFLKKQVFMPGYESEYSNRICSIDGVLVWHVQSPGLILTPPKAPFGEVNLIVLVLRKWEQDHNQSHCWLDSQFKVSLGNVDKWKCFMVTVKTICKNF